MSIKHFYSAKLERNINGTLTVSDCVIVDGYQPSKQHYTTQSYEDMLIKARSHFGFNETVVVYLASTHKDYSNVVAEHPFKLNAAKHLN